MRQFLLLGVFLFCFPLFSQAIPRILTVPGHYPTVQRAIDAAVSGDTVKVEPGLYREALTFKTGVTLTGADRVKVVLMFDTRKAPVLAASNCRGVITNLTFQSVGINPSPYTEKYQPLLKLAKIAIKVDNCTLQNGCGNGINIEDKSQCEIVQCLIQSNRRNGIFVLDKGTSAAMHNNRCLQNGFSGIGFGREATGSAIGNECRDNHLQGIIVTDKGTTVVLKENRCHANRFNGIMLINAASGTIEGNLCQNNLWHGISLADNLSSGVLKNNRCRDNTRCGFYFETENQVRGEGNLCPNNGEINSGYLRYLLLREDFTELEAIATHLRAKKPRFDSGEWQLYFYYTNLTNGWGELKPSKEAWIKQVLEKWRKNKPGSLTPIIVSGELYRDLAWQARTCKWASEVSEEGWKGFSENLHKAWTILSAAENDKIDDPMFYQVALAVRVLGMGQIEEMDRLFKRGIAIEPTFYPLYYIKQVILLPRWCGRPGQVEAFVDQAVKDNFKTEGESLYVRLTTNLMGTIGGKDVKELRFDYGRIKRGHEDLLKRYPQANYFLNSFCLFSGLFGDQKQTRLLMEKIGNQWDKSIWKEEKYFDDYRRWATGQPEPTTTSAPATQPQKNRKALITHSSENKGFTQWAGAELNRRHKDFQSFCQNT